MTIQAPKIELRVSDVDPPAPDRPKTFYRDIRNLPATTYLGVTIRYFNNDDVGLYMQVTGSGTGYTFSTVNLGLLASGADFKQNLDQWATKAKPGAELEEDVILTLRGYTDAGYSNLKWTFNRTVHVVWIDDGDGSWTQDFLNNFDDGTVQGWAAVCEQNCEGGYPTVAVYTDYVLSPNYALGFNTSSVGGQQGRARLYKSFTTPNRNKVYAILDIRYRNMTYLGVKYLEFRCPAGTALVFLGRDPDTAYANYVPQGRWIRVVIPLPKNSTVQIQLAAHHYHPSAATTARIYMDDFKIISKD